MPEDSEVQNMSVEHPPTKNTAQVFKDFMSASTAKTSPNQQPETTNAGPSLEELQAMPKLTDPNLNEKTQSLQPDISSTIFNPHKTLGHPQAISQERIAQPSAKSYPDIRNDHPLTKSSKVKQFLTRMVMALSFLHTVAPVTPVMADAVRNNLSDNHTEQVHAPSTPAPMPGVEMIRQVQKMPADGRLADPEQWIVTIPKDADIKER